MSEPKGRTLPPFPTDDFTLDQLEHALNTCVDGLAMPFSADREGPRRFIGGEFTLPDFLGFMSGHDPERATLVGYADDVPIYEGWDQQYSEHCVIRALISEIRRLRAGRVEGDGTS